MLVVVKSCSGNRDQATPGKEGRFAKSLDELTKTIDKFLKCLQDDEFGGLGISSRMGCVYQIGANTPGGLWLFLLSVVSLD